MSDEGGGNPGSGPGGATQGGATQGGASHAEAIGDAGLFGTPVRRPVGVTMVVLAVTVFGWVSLGRLPVSLLPDLSYPTLTIRTEYPGAAPEDVEERISERVQEAVAVLSGLENYTSISRAGVSDVILEFAWGTNLALVTGEVRERVDRALLPDDAEQPLILRYDPTLDPILRIGVTSSERSLRELRALVEEEVERELETLPGVAAIKVRGGLEKQITIELDPERLALHRLDIPTVGARLQAENVNLAAGRLLEGQTEYVVRTLGEFRDPDEIANLVVAERGDAPIRLRDLGEVVVSARERDVITRVDGRESVEVEIYQEAGANLVEVAQRVKDHLLGDEKQRQYSERFARGEILDPRTRLDAERAAFEKEKDGLSGFERKMREMQLGRLERQVASHRKNLSFMARRLPQDLRISVLSDPSTFVARALGEVRSSAIGGGLLAVLVLFLFLRRLGPTGIVAVSIPLSLIATFAPFDFANVSLNVMSLGGLALGVGMLVDNSIVVLEAITRCREEGDDRRTAALRGVQQVGSAVVASTLTTVAVFFPIVFVHGLAGRIFRDLSMAVVFSLLASLGVALFFIPTLVALGSRERLAADPSAEEASEPKRSAWSNYRSAIRGEGRSFLGRAAVAVFGFPFFLVQLLVGASARVLRGLSFVAVWLGARVFGGLLLGIAFVLQGPAWLLAVFLERFRRGYGALCRRVVAHPGPSALTCVLALGLFLLAIGSFRRLGSELLPEIHQGELVAQVRLAVETPVEETDRTCVTLTERARGLDGVEWISTAAGIARDEIAEPDEGEHSAEVTLHLAPTKDLAALEAKVEDHFLAVAGTLPELAPPKVEPPSILRVQTPLQLEIHGTDLAALREKAQALAARARSIPSLTDVETNFARGPSEVVVEFDRDALHRRGIRLEDAANRLRDAVQGDVATRFTEEERKIDVLLRIDRSRLHSLRAFEELSITGPGEEPVPLRTVATYRVDEGPAEIRQIRGDRVGVVTARPRGFDLGGASRELAHLADGLDLPDDMHWEFGGQSKESDEAMRSLLQALALAVFLVYIVLAAQFESFVQPLIILASIPLATVGVIFTLELLGWNVSVVVLLGAILLAGIVVNNAILLIDAINRLRRDGVPRTEAVVQAAQSRLRPILMTTTTTVLGLLPLTGLLEHLPGLSSLPLSLGGGEGSELRAPMAVTVISGLLSSTLLTLLVIPALYNLTDRLSMRVVRAVRARTATAESPDGSGNR